MNNNSAGGIGMNSGNVNLNSGSRNVNLSINSFFNKNMGNNSFIRMNSLNNFNGRSGVGFGQNSMNGGYHSNGNGMTRYHVNQPTNYNKQN